MADRLTVVFDEPGLYRRLKIQAAREGRPVKALVELAIVQYLDHSAPPAEPPSPIQWDWEAYDRAAEDFRQLEREVAQERSRDLVLGGRELHDDPTPWDTEGAGSPDQRDHPE